MPFCDQNGIDLFFPHKFGTNLMLTVLVAKRHKNYEKSNFLFFPKNMAHRLSKTVLDVPIRLF